VKRVARIVGVRTEGCCQSYEMSGHLAKKGFMTNYLLLH
jgi:hypothetical protein